MHFTFDIFVICALFATWFEFRIQIVDVNRRIAIGKHQQEFIGHFLFDLDRLVISNEMECCFLSFFCE
jgi:hypothetical protein